MFVLLVIVKGWKGDVCCVGNSKGMERGMFVLLVVVKGWKGGVCFVGNSKGMESGCLCRW